MSRSCPLLLCLCTRSADTMDQSSQTDITWSRGRLPSWLTVDLMTHHFRSLHRRLRHRHHHQHLQSMMTCRHNIMDESQSDIMRTWHLPQHHHPPAVLPEERHQHCPFPRHQLLLSPCASPRRDQRCIKLRDSRSASRSSRKSKSTHLGRPFTVFSTRRSRSPRTHWTRCRNQCQDLPPGHRRCLAPCARRKPEHVHCRCWAHCGC